MTTKNHWVCGRNGPGHNFSQAYGWASSNYTYSNISYPTPGPQTCTRCGAKLENGVITPAKVNGGKS